MTRPVTRPASLPSGEGGFDRRSSRAGVRRRPRRRLGARRRRGAASRLVPTPLALRASRPSPPGLADSHIALRGNEGGAAFGGLELEPALEHDDGSGLAVVAGPSAEAGADPCRIGERAPGVGVALSFGPAFEALAQGFEEGQVVRAEGVGDGPEAALTGAAVAGVDELLDGDGGDERRHGELAPGAVLADAHRLDVEALGLEGAEQLLDRPAAAVQVGDREGLGGTVRNLVCGAIVTPTEGAYGD